MSYQRKLNMQISVQCANLYDEIEIEGLITYDLIKCNGA